MMAADGVPGGVSTRETRESTTLGRRFNALDRDRANVVWTWRLLEELKASGLRADDPRVRRALAAAHAGPGFEPGQPQWLDFPQFSTFAEEPVIARAFAGDLVIPDFAGLTERVQRIYDEVLPNRSGEVAQYIRTLREADPDRFGIVVVSRDGQVAAIGDVDVPFSVQSISKAFAYGAALELHGAEQVNRWVDREQSGGPFNDKKLSLDAGGRPRNPMINAGAIAIDAMILPGADESDRYAHLQQVWTRAMSGLQPGFDNPTFLAERQEGDGNFALAHLMRDAGKLMGDPPARAAAEFYFRVCSMEVDARRLGLAAAVLANDGVAPHTGEQVFSPATVRQVKSLMASSGMYDGSGRFADEVGLPAKSGVSGGVIMIAPDFAVVTFSPRLDEAGNSVRGVEVCRRVSEELNLHPHAARGRDAEFIRQVLAGPPVLESVRPGRQPNGDYVGFHRRPEQQNEAGR
jgi:glutaminase